MSARSTTPDTEAQQQKRRFLDHLAALPLVRECLHVTGAEQPPARASRRCYKTA